MLGPRAPGGLNTTKGIKEGRVDSLICNQPGKNRLERPMDIVRVEKPSCYCRRRGATCYCQLANASCSATTSGCCDIIRRCMHGRPEGSWGAKLPSSK